MRQIIGLAAPARSGKDTVAAMLLAHSEVAAFALADPLKLGCQALFGLTDEQTWDDAHKEEKISLWGRSPREFFQQVGTDWMRHHNPNHWLQRAEREINPPLLAHDSHTPELSSPDAPFRLAAQAIFDFSPSQVWDSTKSALIDEAWGLTPDDAVELLKRNALVMEPQYYQKRALLPVRPLKARSPLPDSATTIIIKDIRFENEAEYLRQHNGAIWHISRADLPKVNAHSSELGILYQPGDYQVLNHGTVSQLAQTVESTWAQMNSVKRNVQL